MQFLATIAILATTVAAATTGSRAVATSHATGNFSVQAGDGEMGLILIVNHCAFDVYLKSVDGGPRGREGPVQTIKSHYSHMERMHAVPTPPGAARAGVSLKLSRNPGSFGRGVTQIEYGIDPVSPVVWYDGSNIDCRGQECPFFDTGVMIQSPGEQFGGRCTHAVCHPHSCDSGENWYLVPEDNNAVRNCKQAVGMLVRTCATSPDSPYL